MKGCETMYEQHSTDTYTENAKKQMTIKIIDIIIITIAFFFMLYVFVMNQDYLLKTIIGTLLVILAIIYGSIKYDMREATIVADSEVRKLVLLNDRGVEIDEWLIADQTSLLIGKSTTDNKADIDLSGIEYESLINYEHAVLNYVSGVWYIEDIDSVNGVGIKKAHKRVKNRLKHESPYPIGNGDTIYIANTRILVK